MLNTNMPRLRVGPKDLPWPEPERGLSDPVSQLSSPPLDSHPFFLQASACRGHSDAMMITTIVHVLAS